MRPHDGEDDGASAGDRDERLFAGVRFTLVGFDPASESQVHPPARLDAVPAATPPFSFRFRCLVVTTSLSSARR